MKILIADDNEDTRYILRKTLTAAGHEIAEAANGKEALSLGRQDTPDLIISDILMPEMDGFQFCREVRTDKTFNAIPFVFYTATYTDAKDEELALELGADLFIRKPMEGSAFVEAIKNITTKTEAGEIKQAGPALEYESDYLKLYNQRLIRKLEKKNEELKNETAIRLKAEFELRESESKYRELFENSPDGISMTTIDGRILDANDAFLDIYGYSREEIAQMNASQFYVDGDERRAVISTILKQGYVRSREIQCRRKDGTQVTCVISAVTRKNRQDNTTTIQSITRDVSTLRALQKQLMQAQKLESMGLLAGGIAHDFNNILSSIIGYSELALVDVDKGSLSEESLREIYAAGMRARDLVKQILAFARKSGEEIRPIKINTIVMEVLKFIRSSIPTTIEIRQRISSASLVMGNPTQIHQILMNLCTNAAQAMEESGGVLEMSVEDFLVEEDYMQDKLHLKPGNYVKIRVSDSGAGIVPEAIERIFEPYFTTKPLGKGTGMGLAVAHGIVESHGGKIIVDSEVEKGATFSVFLPATESQESEVTASTENLPTGTEHVLIIDDEVSITSFSSRMLELLGYSVTSKNSSTEALEMFRASPELFDLVISDQTMPKLTGDELARELVRIRPDIPIILCTGYSRKLAEDSLSEIGVKAIANKPIVKAELAELVRKVLDGANFMKSNQETNGINLDRNI